MVMISLVRAMGMVNHMRMLLVVITLVHHTPLQQVHTSTMHMHSTFAWTIGVLASGKMPVHRAMGETMVDALRSNMRVFPPARSMNVEMAIPLGEVPPYPHSDMSPHR